MLMLIILLLLIFLGVPLFAVIGLSAIWGFLQQDVDLIVIAIEIYRLVDMPVLIAVPLFTFAGYVLGESNAAARLVKLSDALLGRLPGGLPIVAIITCALLTAFTGASGVTIVALGALLYPALRQAGYKERFSLGLLTSSGSLGLLFAPSLPLILYGVVAQQVSQEIPVNIDDLFIAGILPGLLMLIVLSVYSMFVSRELPLATFTVDAGKPTVSRSRQITSALKEAIWELPLPFVVLGGIYGGYFAISEAAAITAMYVFVVEVFIRREVSWRNLPLIIKDSMMLVGAILVILGASLASTNYLIDAGVPQQIFEIIHKHIDDKWTFLIALNIFLLVLGMMLDIFSAIVIMIPIILPVALGYGVHPVHLGIIFLANMQIGYFTPPVGMNLFIASYRFNKPILTLCYAAIPFFLLLMLCVLIITYWPALSLGLLDTPVVAP
ncbi:MAG: TRAP transporter large permease subunit [Gammaproteobacteria bacterium]|nr:TRAP transporter large permease subunit [Gammaproteobacteria bacterium]